MGRALHIPACAISYLVIGPYVGLDSRAHSGV